MAISQIEITQDNIINGSDLLAVHSPLIFLASVTHNATPIPDFIDVLLYKHTDFVGGKTLVETFRAILLNDNSATERVFMFQSDGILRSYMKTFDNFVQLSDTIVFCENFTQIFTIRFEDPDNNATFAEVKFTAIHASGQFVDGQNKQSIYTNQIETLIGIPNFPAIVYFYSDEATSEKTFTITKL